MLTVIIVQPLYTKVVIKSIYFRVACCVRATCTPIHATRTPVGEGKGHVETLSEMWLVI